MGLTRVAKSDQSTGNHHFASYVMQSGAALRAWLVLLLGCELHCSLVCCAALHAGCRAVAVAVCY
jgi:hypothetical protein